jgi:hypothetical protein
VWADFAGTLGRVEDALTGTPIHGAALKEVIRRGTVIICHRDNTDPAHPTLKVDGTEAAGQPGTSLTLASLADVDNAAATAPAGKVLGTTGTGTWGPVDPPSSPAPSLALDDLVDVDAPAGTPVGNMLVATGSGRWVVSQVVWEDALASTMDLARGLSGKANFPPVWSSTTTYNTGDLVHYQGTALYRSKLPNNVNHAPSFLNPSAWWERYDLAAVADRADGAWIRWTGTQAAYDAITPKNAWTLYVITS